MKKLATKLTLALLSIFALGNVQAYSDVAPDVDAVPSAVRPVRFNTMLENLTAFFGAGTIFFGLAAIAFKKETQPACRQKTRSTKQNKNNKSALPRTSGYGVLAALSATATAVGLLHWWIDVKGQQ